MQWLRDGLEIIGSASEIEAIALKVPDTGGVTIVPAFVGMGAPHWRSSARGVITGLTLGTRQSHIARATLEGIALQNVDILKAMESDSGRQLLRLKVDGGASANNLLMQMQADFLDCSIVRPQIVETTALGAALLAGLGAGIWGGFKDIAGVWKEDRTFVPEMDDNTRRAVLDRWDKAVARA